MEKIRDQNLLEEISEEKSLNNVVTAEVNKTRSESQNLDIDFVKSFPRRFSLFYRRKK